MKLEEVNGAGLTVGLSESQGMMESDVQANLAKQVDEKDSVHVLLAHEDFYQPTSTLVFSHI